jgi:glycosyltransferase involved in cell wall biosynthesis
VSVGADRVGVTTFELADGGVVPDLSGAPRWRIILLLHGVPVGQIELSTPSGQPSPRFVDAAVRRHGRGALARERLLVDVGERMGLLDVQHRRVEGSEPGGPSVSVVLCTHRRPDCVPKVLTGLAKLVPAPAEVIVVDNDPGDDDCAEAVTGAGFLYVREGRRGLDHARNAGVAAATGDLIAFIDDDCVPSTGWLAPMPRLFSDLAVACVTGPMFPWRLDTGAQQLMDRVAGMVRGYQEERFDWRTLSVAHASATGVGANMTFRRQALASLGPAPFPPELDAGTMTESGGDTYVLARLIALGHRIVYSPAAWGYHDHRADPASMVRAVYGYGVGISAAMTKLLVEDREFEAWRGYAWLAHQHVRSIGRLLLGRSDRGYLYTSRRYVIGGLKGPFRWFASRGHLSDAVAPAARASPNLVDARKLDDDAQLKPIGITRGLRAVHHQKAVITIVIPTARPFSAIHRCIAALEDQTVRPGSFEVIVVDDRAEQRHDDPPTLPRTSFSLEIVSNSGSGASAARNSGARRARTSTVLFLDDDVIVSPGLIERHMTRHRESTADRALAVVGPYWPAPISRDLMASALALTWSDCFRSLANTTTPTFTGMLSGNLSVSRAHFLELGGFCEAIPYRREDWELGVRWLRAGYDLVFEPDAHAVHEFAAGTPQRPTATELEAFGDAMIARTHHGTAGTLPVIEHRPLRSGIDPRNAAHAILRRRSAVALCLGVLEMLDRAHLRGTWRRLMRIVQSVAYKQGIARAGVNRSKFEERIVDFDVLGGGSLAPAGGVPPTVRLHIGPRLVATVRPHEGRWDNDLSKRLVDQLNPEQMNLVAKFRGWLPTVDVEQDSDELQRIEVVEGNALEPGFWDRVEKARHESDRELLALVLAADVTDNRWVRQALIAFDEDDIVLTFGWAIDGDLPMPPIKLFDRRSRPALPAGSPPAYMLIRREALVGTGGLMLPSEELGNFGEALALITDALAEDWRVASIDVHGLSASAVAQRAFGRARASATMSSARLTRTDLVVRAVRLIAQTSWTLHRREPSCSARDVIQDAIGGLQELVEKAVKLQAPSAPVRRIRRRLRSVPFSNPDGPKVTVVIPTRNRKSMLLEAAGDVLAQSNVDLELIVIDDGSTDPHALDDLAEADPRIRVLRHSHSRGVAAARAAGIQNARGEWIAFLDDDDRWSPDKLQMQLDAAATAGTNWVYGGVINIDHRNAPLSVEPSRSPAEVMARLDGINPVPGGCSNIIARTALVREVGGFDPEYSVLADWDLWLRFAEQGPPAACEDIVVGYRLHNGNMHAKDIDQFYEELGRLTQKHAASQLGPLKPDLLVLLEWHSNAVRRSGNRVAAARMAARRLRLTHDPADLARIGGALAGGRTSIRQTVWRLRTARPRWLDSVPVM